MSLRQEPLKDSSSISRKQTKSRRRKSKPKRLTKRQLQLRLSAAKGGGWSSKMVDNPRQIKIAGGQTYDVTLADRLKVLQMHRNQLVKPLLKGKFSLPKIDKDSFVQQEEAYDGERTDISFSLNMPKKAQKWLEGKQGEMGDHSYFDYLEDTHGEPFMRKYWEAEQKALDKTFGERGAKLAQLGYEEVYDDGETQYLGTQVWNEWHDDFEEFVRY